MNLRRMIALFAVAVLTIAAADAPRVLNWNTRIAVNPDGSHVLGNPAAKVKLTEWISYTCPHCAHFTTQSEAPLRISYVAPGRVQIEVRNLVRDPVDMTVAMLVNCGPPSKFFLNHTAFLTRQDSWIQPMFTASAVQRQRWTSGDNRSRFRAIATDFHLYEIMESRGYDRSAVERCLADSAMATRLAAMTRDASDKGINGTPGFAIDGVVLAGTHSWDMLQPQLAARF